MPSLNESFFGEKLNKSYTDQHKLKIEKINLSTEFYFYYFINKTERFTDITIEGTKINFPKVLKIYFFFHIYFI
jgi:hypothetical protein